MTTLDTIVQVSIDTQTTTPTQKGFGIPLLVGFHTKWAERVRFYTSLAAMVTDGFATSDALYRAAQAVFAQNPRPEKVAIGRLTVASTMTVNIVPVVRNSYTYHVEINGVDITFTSDGNATLAEVIAGLVAAINGSSVAAAVTASNIGPDTSMRIVADVPGTVFRLYINVDDYSRSDDTTDASGIAAQLAAISLENDEWYCLIMDSMGQPEIEAAAAYIETVKKVALFTTGDTDVLAAPLTDVAGVLKSAAYKRSAVLFSKRPHEYPNAAWAGRVLPTLPGSATWMFKTLAGITVDSFTSTQMTNMLAKFCNFYKTVAGINITSEGRMAQGEYIDVTIFVDWLQARIQETIFGIKANMQKVPFTDQGIATIDAGIRARLEEGINNGGLIRGTTQVIVPLAKNVSQADRAARRLTGVTFQGQLAGAVHKTIIQGTVTV